MTGDGRKQVQAYAEWKQMCEGKQLQQLQYTGPRRTLLGASAHAAGRKVEGLAHSQLPHVDLQGQEPSEQWVSEVFFSGNHPY